MACSNAHGIHGHDVHPLMCLLCVRQQAKLGEYKAAERAEWLASTIARAFADPIDAASLSHRFARFGEAQRLDAVVWKQVANFECASPKVTWTKMLAYLAPA